MEQPNDFIQKVKLQVDRLEYSLFDFVFHYFISSLHSHVIAQTKVLKTSNMLKNFLHVENVKNVENVENVEKLRDSSGWVLFLLRGRTCYKTCPRMNYLYASIHDSFNSRCTTNRQSRPI